MSEYSVWPGPFTDEECEAAARLVLERGYVGTTVLGEGARTEGDGTGPVRPAEEPTT